MRFKLAPVVSTVITKFSGILAYAMVCALAMLMFMPMAHAEPPTALTLSGHKTEVALGRHLQTFEDSQHQLTITTLISQPIAWAAHPSDSVNFGFSRSTWWLRLPLRNGEAKPVSWVLDLSNPLQDETDIHIVRSGGQLDPAIMTGDRRPFASRLALTRIPQVPIHFAPGESLEVYIRLGTHDGLHEALLLNLWQPAAYATQVQTETTALGVYYGALIAVLLYNLFLYVSTRDRGFGLYTIYIVSFFIWSFTFRGFAYQYWWPNSPNFNNQILPIAAAACFFTFGQFSMYYLHTRRNVKAWMHKLLICATWGSLLSVTPAIFNHYALSFAISSPFGIILMVSAISAGISMMRQGSRPARYFLIAFSLLSIGVMLYYLRVLGVVPSNAITENFLQIGSGLEVMLLAFGLADQMNTLKADKLNAERAALQAQTTLNNDLELLVKNRTEALEAANQRLADLAITDALTGAYNRRHFDSVFEAEVARQSRQRTPMAFCLLDIDNFKLYNDHYGHPAGDEVLKQVASTMIKRLRREGDMFFRVGGEEFAMLLNVDEPRDKARIYVESLCAELQQLGIPHEGNTARVVTASFGLVLFSGETTTKSPADIYAIADKLLYQAKHAGRNQVQTEDVMP